MSKNMAHQDPENNIETRTRVPKFDINRIDYGWIEKNSNVKEMKLAYEELEMDGCFPDLLKTLGKRISTFDARFGSRMNGNEQKLSAEEENAINDDMMNFLSNINSQDDSLKSGKKDILENRENKSIFSNGGTQLNNDPKLFETQLSQNLENKRTAENERLKGNEFVKSKDFELAITAYSRSIKIQGDEPFTYANRAMAYLKNKNFMQAVDDATKAIELKPGYLKAYHRRGKANQALNNYQEAVDDFQFILEEQPDNKDVNKDLKQARKGLMEKQAKNERTEVTEIIDEEISTTVTEDAPPAKKLSTPKQTAKPKGFKRVAIEEDSSDEEPKIVDETIGNASSDLEIVKGIDSPFPHKTAKEIDAHAREAKRLMKKGAVDFQKRWENKDQEARKDSVPLIEEIDTHTMEDVTSKNKNSKNKKKDMVQKGKEMMNEQQKKLAEIKQKQAVEEKKMKEAKEQMEKQIAETKLLQAKADQMKAEQSKAAAEAKAALDEKNAAEAELAKAQAQIQETVSTDEFKKSLDSMGGGDALQREKEGQDVDKSEVDKATQEKKLKQKGKIDKLLKKCQDYKDEAAAKVKSGQYGDAVKVYMKGTDSLESAIEDFPLWKQELTEYEASLFNNISVCHNKDLNSKLEIEYTSKVIDRAQWISDPTMLIKAFLRRGKAYEAVEKFLEAKEDMLSVKSLNANNKQASEILNRCNKAIKEIYGNKVPETKKRSPIKLAEPTAQQTQQKTESAPPAPFTVKENHNEVNQNADKIKEAEAEKTFSAKELSEEILKYKDLGNAQFKQKQFLTATQVFEGGINFYMKHQSQCKKDKDVMQKVTQLYTNRSLSFHNLDQQEDAFNDANYVVENIDACNTKALNRRAHYYRTKSQLVKAEKDYALIVKLDKKSPVSKDLAEVRKLIEKEKQNKQRVQEMDIPTKASEVEEEEEEVPVASKSYQKVSTPNLDEESVAKAAAQASAAAQKQTISSIPKTASGFEKDIRELKNSSNIYQYLQKIPMNTLTALFKKSQVQAEVLSPVLEAFVDHGLSDSESILKTGEFLMNWSRSSSYDMTLMFIDDAEKKHFKTIGEALKKSDANLFKQYDAVYGDL